MRVIFLKEQGTLSVTDDNGKCIHKLGDDKVMCHDLGTAYTIVEVLSQLVGRRFFEEDKGPFQLWESPGDFDIR